MTIGNSREILEDQDRKKAEVAHLVHVVKDNNHYNVVKFVKGYVPLE